MRVLILGCGHRKKREIVFKGREDGEIVTLDHNPLVNPNVQWDLNQRPLPFDSDSFDEVHAYEVLEHLGTQGDYLSFFHEFGEYWRILKPGGLFCGSVPLPDSIWAWGDPSHRRVLPASTFEYLNQDIYKNIGKNAVTDFRDVWERNFRRVWSQETESRYYFALQKT